MDSLQNITCKLKTVYDENTVFLHFEKDWQFVLAVLLSPRTKDKDVQIVAQKLFEKYPSLEQLSNANEEDVQNILKPLGFFRQKGRIIIDASRYINEHGIPNSMDELLKIKGMGRKCASVVLSVIFNSPAIVVDTHFLRVLNRIGISEKNPAKLEYKVSSLLDSSYWIGFSTLINIHGRRTCGKNPKCDNCIIKDMCDKKI